jgi:hypothetical protein
MAMDRMSSIQVISIGFKGLFYLFCYPRKSTTIRGKKFLICHGFNRIGTDQFGIGQLFFLQQLDIAIFDNTASFSSINPAPEHGVFDDFSVRLEVDIFAYFPGFIEKELPGVFVD